MKEQCANADFLSQIMRHEARIDMRNTMTIGDMLCERASNAVVRSAFVLLDAQFDANGWPRFIHDWLKAPSLEVKSALITEIAIEQGSPVGRYAYEKVSRTPADAPIVGAMSYIERNGDGAILDARLAVCGVADYPIPLPSVDEELISTNGDLDRALSKLNVSPQGDHWGSSDYRTAMTRVLSRRVLSQTL